MPEQAFHACFSCMFFIPATAPGIVKRADIRTPVFAIFMTICRLRDWPYRAINRITGMNEY